MAEPIAADQEDVELSAEMEKRQFRSLELHLCKDKLLLEVGCLKRLQSCQRRKDFDEDGIVRWLRNGWSTEALLRATPEKLASDDLGYALHWAFPQSYYSVFAVTLACLSLLGDGEVTHAGVIRRFGQRLEEKCYPGTLSFWASGTPDVIELHGVSLMPTSSTLALDESSPGSIANQIAQFLRATRHRDLVEKKRDMKFTTKSGTPRQKFSHGHWVKTAGRLGNTSILSLLYRKRIKSNYGDVSSYQHWRIDAPTVFRSLIHVVSCLNLVHEAYIEKAAGRKACETLIQRASGNDYDFVTKRRRRILETLEGASRNKRPHNTGAPPDGWRRR